MNIDKLKFDNSGLIPVIIQDNVSDKVLMMAYMNRQSLEKTIETGFTWFYSRSRKKLWNKGETSGNTQQVKQISYDCDEDCLLIKVEQKGSACHTGKASCFHRILTGAEEKKTNIEQILNEVYQVIKDRQTNRPEGSYTSYLFNEGQDKILKKVGEEAAEIIISSKNNAPKEVIYESADFIYHLLVLFAYHNLTIDELTLELEKRR